MHSQVNTRPVGRCQTARLGTRGFNESKTRHKGVQWQQDTTHGGSMAARFKTSGFNCCKTRHEWGVNGRNTRYMGVQWQLDLERGGSTKARLCRRGFNDSKRTQSMCDGHIQYYKPHYQPKESNIMINRSPILNSRIRLFNMILVQSLLY